jgi:chromatin structure-remodeling complex subunit RSC3/30
MASHRRNGMQASCEPCRRSKLRCDHSTPICKRCVRRGKSDACVYHPAPMTRSRYSEQVSSSSHTAASSDTSLPAQYIADWDKKTQLVPPPGSLGLTSYAGVFSENEDYLSGINAPLTTFPRDQAVPSPKQVRLGAQLLLTLCENLSFYETLAERLFEISPEGCHRPPTCLYDLYSFERGTPTMGKCQGCKPAVL